MNQNRFSILNVGFSLNDLTQAVGFRGDIGYQSFLYSNVTEVRRVFMFLIERLPKEADKEHHEDINVDKKSMLEYNFRHSLKIQLNAAWTVQYCKKFGARKFGNLIVIEGSNNGFLPQPLNVPHATAKNQSAGKFAVLYSSKFRPLLI